MLSESILNHIQHLGMSQSQEPIQILLDMSQLSTTLSKASLPVNNVETWWILRDQIQRHERFYLTNPTMSEVTWHDSFQENMTNKQTRYTQVTTIPSITNGWKRKMIPFTWLGYWWCASIAIWHPNNLLILLIHPGCIEVPSFETSHLNLVPTESVVVFGTQPTYHPLHG